MSLVVLDILSVKGPLISVMPRILHLSRLSLHFQDDRNFASTLPHFRHVYL